MEEDLYDEFGNYIGPDLNPDQEEADEDLLEQQSEMSLESQLKQDHQMAEQYYEKG
jgi:hypothetical protein